MIFGDQMIVRNLFQNKFHELLKGESSLQNVIYDMLAEGAVYIIGGYVRDTLNGKESRDVDIVADIPQEKLLNILNDNRCVFDVNRFGGMKLFFSHTEVDLWNIHDNWAFRTKLVKLNENDKLDSLAKGCFYNYDALVLNIPKFHYNIRYYCEFLETGVLHTMQKQSIYKSRNPMAEANLIRAIYIKKNHQCAYSDELLDYFLKLLFELKLEYGDVVKRLMLVKEDYSKYNSITEQDIRETIVQLTDIKPIEPSLFDDELHRILV